MQLPAPTGVNVRYIGPASLGTTNWYYWVQAIYPDGNSQLSVAGSTGAKAPSGLSSAAFNQVEWNPMPGAIGYLIFSNTTGTTPTSGTTILAFIGTSETGFKDDGTIARAAAKVRYDGINVAQAKYDFTVDGGVVGAITPAFSDTIPAGAIMIGGTINSTVAVTSTGSATVAIGTTAGSSSSALLAATAKASLSLDALLNAVPVLATPVKMTAAGQINLTVGTAALTAGLIEIFIYYVIPSLL